MQPLIKAWSQLRENLLIRGYATEKVAKMTPAGLTLKETTIALNAREPIRGSWRGGYRPRIINHIPSEQDLVKPSPAHKNSIRAALEVYAKQFPDTKKFQDTPVFNLKLSPQPAFNYAGTLGRLTSLAVRANLINGNYHYLPKSLDVKAENKSTRTVDTIVTTDHADQIHPRQMSDSLIKLVVIETIQLAISKEGISEEDPYSDVKVYKYTPKDSGDGYYTDLGPLLQLRNWAKQVIHDRDFSIIPKCTREITHLSNGGYKDISAIVLGVRGLHPRELRNNQLPGTVRKKIPVILPVNPPDGFDPFDGLSITTPKTFNGRQNFHKTVSAFQDQFHEKKHHHEQLIFNTNLDEGKKVAVKMNIHSRPACWVGTDQSVILPFSIHSALYNGDEGKIKVAALLRYVKTHVKGRITVLFCEKAHVEVLSLKYGNNAQTALNQTSGDAQQLKERFKAELEGLHIMSWIDFVDGDEKYQHYKDLVLQLYQSNEDFRTKIREDAESTYHSDRQKECADKEIYLNKCFTDVLEHCVYVLIATSRGYKYEFYPGKGPESVEFVNQHFSQNETKLIRVNVGLHPPQYSSLMNSAIFSDMAFLERILTPYNPECRYLKKACVISSTADSQQEIALTVHGEFSISKSIYIENTGHFNSVEFNICYNQLAYYLLAECVRHKLLAGLSDWDIEEFTRRQLSDFLIVSLSSSFTKPINPTNFTGQIKIERVDLSKKKNLVVHTRCTFSDEHGGQCDGAVILAIILN